MPGVHRNARRGLLAVALATVLGPGKTTVAAAADDAAAWAALQRNGAIVLFRHADAPGVGDPPGLSSAPAARRVKRQEEGDVAAMSGTALSTDGRFRFVASGRTSRPWITLIALRGVH